MKPSEIIERYNKGERDFAGVYSWRDDFDGADLSGSDFTGAILTGSNFTRAKLNGAVFFGADLIEANFTEADLSGANLSCAYLTRANFSCAYLARANSSGADLTGADLTGADLSWADLAVADLSWANLAGANLTDTVLSPLNKIPCPTAEELANAGFKIDGDFAIGYRTMRSMIVGSTEYLPGCIYTAPVLSIDQDTDCHPGLYLAPKVDWLVQNYCVPTDHIIVVATPSKEIVKAGDKYRCKRLLVLGRYEECEL